MAEKEGMQAGFISQSLSDILHANPGGYATFYRRAQRVLNDPVVDIETKQGLIRLLSRAATPAAVQLLADLWRQGVPERLEPSILAAISEVGDYFWSKGSFPEVAPTLLQLWRQSQDPRMLSAVAAAMANMADPGSLEVLFEAVLGAGKSPAELQRSSDPRVSAAWSALQRLHTTDSAAAVASRLRSGTSAGETAITANVLAGIGQIEATQALLSWATGLGDGYVPLVREAFARVRTAECVNYLKSAMSSNPAFASELVRQAILAELDKRRP
ncbi:MAG: hypothetical protein HXY20_09665 [Acidobacteria bacterium]|nr:hypothetical protein [Acidobacteriota bacterium]